LSLSTSSLSASLHILPSPASTLFPYTTLFRSVLALGGCPVLRAHREGACRPRHGDRRPVQTGTPGSLRASGRAADGAQHPGHPRDRKSTRLNSSHQIISYAVFCLKKKITILKQ